MGFFSWLFKKNKAPKPFDVNEYQRMTEKAKKAGEVNGRHYTDYGDEIDTLKKEDPSKAIALLLKLVNAAEAQARIEKLIVPPAYYRELAIVYRKQKEYDKEVAILQRFVDMQQELGSKSNSDMLDRLEKAKKLAQSSD